jgi:chemotaxis protein methyltransferase WspC
VSQADFAGLLKQAVGLDSNSVGISSIERAVRLRMTNTGLNQVDAYWEYLLGSGQELQQLVEAVVVPETWFFRDRPAFCVLTDLIVAGWRSSRNGKLHLLSIPCSTGEEPYSLVIALLEAGLTPEEFQVDAVDISANALALARRGLYGANSFRGDDLAFRDRYFTPNTYGYELNEEVRRNVAFRSGNLLTERRDPSRPPYDVIFCRNVLIYFDRVTQESAMKVLKDILKPSGFLFVGPAEAFLAAASGFTAINRPMSFAFRRADKERSAPTAPAPLAKLERPRAVPVIPPRPVVLPKSAHPITPAPAPKTDSLQRAKTLADAGSLREAADCCEAYLKQSGPNAEAYYLLGLVRDAGGDYEAATKYYRKALYLEPDHLQATLHLALIAAAQGDVALAGRLRERARRIEEDQKRKGK